MIKAKRVALLDGCIVVEVADMTNENNPIQVYRFQYPCEFFR